ncbi:hypothetical protein NUU61_005140 [Penicillium alfredii]|uniref:Non-homologous end-joining factor 1 n=1 Tax=Penicillium alfredii TaxID=1506179 RepID=A0A9W9F906_9EURO|nr:uncharacterized protein NUU61_005140 [Penicillium alfredii]KAJ5095784.1 hypothetical protein NUU61_005140 [Penicillium alfredii]
MSFLWHRLNLPPDGLPPLLFQYIWTRQGYELYMTDLTSIWTERLPHKEVVKRAEADATTIDPSEDPGQFTVLLQKIGEALHGDGGKTTLKYGSQADSLELTTTTKLPAPLKPLRWSLYLSKASVSSVTSRLLLPLLREEAERESRQRSLLDQLKQKDWVLSKLFDKVETLGVDLGTVFPGAPGLRTIRKGSSWPDAAKFIKGAAPFDEKTWLAEARESSPGGLGLAANLVQEISGSASSRDLKDLTAPEDKWWNQLIRRSETLATPATPYQEEEEEEDEKNKEPAITNTPKDIDLDADSTTGSEDDEFERQETPPRLKPQETKAAASPPKSKPKKKKSLSPQPPAAEEDEATATESEPEPEPAPLRRRTPSISPPPKPAPAPAPAKPQAQEPPKRLKGGLGVIGGKKKQPPPPSPPAPSASVRAPTSLTSPRPPHEPLKPAADKEAAPPASAMPPTKTKRPTKLGMIGGKAKPKAPEQTETVAAAPEPLSTSSPERVPPTRSARLEDDDLDSTGLAARKPLKAESPSRASLVTAKPSVIPSAPEPEEAKADRKREELKRQLDVKSKAPAKKKRRF